MTETGRTEGALPVVLDTDIGSDVDDLLALIVIAGEPRINLLAVTTVYGDVNLRARIAKRALRLLGHANVPVHAGIARPRSGREVWWGGHEGHGMASLDNEEIHHASGVDALIAAGRQHAGRLTVIAIGPLTNVAEAIERDSAWAANVRRLVVMGGEFAHGTPEHNVRSDVEAARVVLASGMPSLFVGLDVTTSTVFDSADLDAVTQRESPAAMLVTDQVRSWWAKIGTQSCHPHDPLAVLGMLEPDLFDFEQGGWRVSRDGDDLGALRPDASVPAVTYATAVRAEAARLSLRRRLAAVVNHHGAGARSAGSHLSPKINW